jgi:hypothetical protein
MLFWIVVARPEDVVHLEHDEPELGVGEEVRSRHEAGQTCEGGAGGCKGDDEHT